MVYMRYTDLVTDLEISTAERERPNRLLLNMCRWSRVPNTTGQLEL